MHDSMLKKDDFGGIINENHIGDTIKEELLEEVKSLSLLLLPQHTKWPGFYIRIVILRPYPPQSI